MSNIIYKKYFDSPVGLLEVVGTSNSITSLNFIDEVGKEEFNSNKYLDLCVKQVEEYFDGTRKEFELSLNPEGTAFQKKVWEQLLKINYGETRSYLWQSKMLGDSLAIRAVASANGQNKISIIIPCHRVIGKDGSLTGYAGGLWRKKWLLDHEQKFFDGQKQLEMF